MKYKAKDIARELGVSPATVSLVLNNKPGVGEAKRREILEKIMEMDCEYLLKEGESHKGDIGLVIYKCGGQVVEEYPFFNYLSESITRTLEKNGYTMVVMYLDKEMPADEQYLALENAGCTGFIVYAVEMYPEDTGVFRRLSRPCVFLDNPFPTLSVDTVTVDNRVGIYQGFEYLYEMGHRRIGYIKSKFQIICFEERFRAFRECMRRRGWAYREDYVMDVGYLESETEADVEHYLDRHRDLPTAFLADNDLLACRAVQVFKRRGIRVPEDVSVVGFDNRPICSFTEPKVATIQLPSNEMGGMAVDLLMKRLKREDMVAIKYKIGTRLIENESVKQMN